MASLWLTTLLLVVIYLGVVRLVDLNEKEPLWAMLMFFGLGGAASAIVRLALPATLALRPWPMAIAGQLALLVALVAGLGALTLHARWRGWNEFDGTLDGLVYGMTAGLGAGTGRQLLGGLMLGSAGLPGLEPAPLATLGGMGLRGLADGIYGGLIGVSFGLAWELRSPAMRAIVPAIGLAASVLASYVHGELGRADAFGDFGLLRARIALVLPALFLAVAALFALRREAQAIRTELADEAESGCVSPTDLALLTSFARRECWYWRALLAVDSRRWWLGRRLHKQQAQLAFAKQRLAREPDSARRVETQAMVNRIRTSVLAIQEQMAAGRKA
jgi:hypothetical protein